MWIASRFGFFSIVKKGGSVASPKWSVRARVRADLVSLCKATNLPVNSILATKGTDYPFRIILSAAHCFAVFEVLAGSIDYDNFKNMIGQTPGQQAKLPAYHSIWGIMARLGPGCYHGGGNGSKTPQRGTRAQRLGDRPWDGESMDEFYRGVVGEERGPLAD